MDESQQLSLLSFAPAIVTGLLLAIPASLLAKEKGRSPWKWAILCLIPIVNFACFFYFVGTPSTRLEQKIDALFQRQGGSD